MKLLVVGGGGREHAIVKKLRENPTVTELYVCPGNGGIALDAVCTGIPASDIPAMVDFALKSGVGYAVVAPDDPLVAGAVDAFEKAGIPCFGPRAEAAMIEGSKVFAKNLMKKYGIPTARFETFTDRDKALAYLETAPIPTVVKADGLALGKGVVVAKTRQEAVDAVNMIMTDRKFGKSGDALVIEEYLEGPEVSVLSFTDGKTIVPMVSSMDHKRALDGDEGPNTGGMGTIAPNPFYTEEIAAVCMEKIFLPTVAAMNAEGRTFKGCLYFGLMLTQDGPKVIEYNCRFGDPEAQVVLPLLKSDLLTVMQSVTEGRLSEVPVEFEKGCACCVVLAAEGYPVSYRKGAEITFSSSVRPYLDFAGVAEKDGKLYTNGGRVIGAVAKADSLREAVDLAYGVASEVRFDGCFFRKDIGKRALSMR